MHLFHLGWTTLIHCYQGVQKTFRQELEGESIFLLYWLFFIGKSRIKFKILFLTKSFIIRLHLILKTSYYHTTPMEHFALRLVLQFCILVLKRNHIYMMFGQCWTDLSSVFLQQMDCCLNSPHPDAFSAYVAHPPGRQSS